MVANPGDPGSRSVDEREEHVHQDCGREEAREQMPPLSQVLWCYFPTDKPKQNSEGKEPEWQYFTNNLLRAYAELRTACFPPYQNNPASLLPKLKIIPQQALRA